MDTNSDTNEAHYSFALPERFTGIRSKLEVCIRGGKCWSLFYFYFFHFQVGLSSNKDHIHEQENAESLLIASSG